MSTYEFLIAVHILAAVLWVGGGATLHLMGLLARRSGDRQRMLQFVRDSDFIGPRFYAPLSLTLLVAGIFLVDESGYEFSDNWVGIGLAVWAISFAIGVGYYKRAGEKLEGIVEGGGIASPAFLAQYKQVANVNVVELTLLLIAVVTMAIKP